jgi:hypothetical protein
MDKSAKGATYISYQPVANRSPASAFGSLGNASGIGPGKNQGLAKARPILRQTHKPK